MASFLKAHNKTIQEAFEKFDARNPKIYELFKKFTFQIIEKRKGKANKKTSAKLIINRIRWEIYLETLNDDGYRINDAWSSRYARKFIQEHPEHADVFNFRLLRSH
jgi:ABC-type proline/glycine betaine transport system substrate-binding protein